MANSVQLAAGVELLRSHKSLADIADAASRLPSPHVEEVHKSLAANHEDVSRWSDRKNVEANATIGCNIPLGPSPQVEGTTQTTEEWIRALRESSRIIGRLTRGLKVVNLDEHLCWVDRLITESALRDATTRRPSMADTQTARLMEAINWACGCADEGFEPHEAINPKQRPYWWRDELTKRAGLVYNGTQFVPAAPPVAMSTPTAPVVGEARTAVEPRKTILSSVATLRQLLEGYKPLANQHHRAVIQEMLPRLQGWGRVVEVAVPAPQEPVQTETRDPYGIEYFVATQPLLETISAMGQEISRLKALAPPVADVPSGDTGLTWLPQPDSEGWWWHKLGQDVQALEVTTLLPALDDERRVLYVSALSSSANYCGGLWQKVADPK